MSAPTYESELGSRYRLKRPLGRGGMASVWEAEDVKLRRPVAIKIISEHQTGNLDAQRRFEREAMAVAQLRSPHIVQLHDYGVAQGRPYMVMELLRGQTLAQRIRRVRRLGLTTAARLARQLGRALATAHEAGIIHRDVKPSNVFLVSDHGEERAMVFDFGIAKALQPLQGSMLTQEHIIVGTPRYMSPEQMAGSPDIDASTDLWSFAIILFRLVTGQVPFNGDGLAEVIEAVVRQPTPRASDLLPGLPKGLDDFFARALAKDAADRFPSALVMAEAFAASAAPSRSVQRRAAGVAARLAVLPPPQGAAGGSEVPPGDEGYTLITPPPLPPGPISRPPDSAEAPTRVLARPLVRAALAETTHRSGNSPSTAPVAYSADRQAGASVVSPPAAHPPRLFTGLAAALLVVGVTVLTVQQGAAGGAAVQSLAGHFAGSSARPLAGSLAAQAAGPFQRFGEPEAPSVGRCPASQPTTAKPQRDAGSTAAPRAEARAHRPAKTLQPSRPKPDPVRSADPKPSAPSPTRQERRRDLFEEPW